MPGKQSEAKCRSAPPGPVLMVSPLYLPEVYGGAEQQCQRLSSVLLEKGVGVGVLAGWAMAGEPPLEPRGGVPIARLRVPSTPELGGRQILATLIWTLRAWQWLRRNGSSYSVLHVHQAKLHALPVLLYGWRRNVAIIVKVGNAEEGFDIRRLARKQPLYGRWVARLLLRRTDRFIAISARIREQLLECGVEPHRIASIPNGIPVDASPICRPRAGVTEARAFLLLGRMTEQKNPLGVCRAFLAATRRGLKGKLIAVGDGELLPAMRAFCASAHEGDRIEILGRRNDVPHLLARASFIVFASRAEGLSNALLEAMNAGVVPIASAISGAKDVVTSECGFLFDVGDETALEKALLAADDLEQSQLDAMSEAARRRIAEAYRIDRVADAYVELYHRVSRGQASLQ